MYFRVFFDTAPIIYFLDNSPLYYKRVNEFIFSDKNEYTQFYTSVMSDLEYLTQPYKTDKKEKIEAYWSFLHFTDFKKIDITSEIAELAAKLRGKYDGLKAQDSLQIAACIFYECDAFLTNDKRLLQIDEIHAVLVENLPSE